MADGFQDSVEGETQSLTAEQQEELAGKNEALALADKTLAEEILESVKRTHGEGIGASFGEDAKRFIALCVAEGKKH